CQCTAARPSAGLRCSAPVSRRQGSHWIPAATVRNRPSHLLPCLADPLASPRHPCCRCPCHRRTPRTQGRAPSPAQPAAVQSSVLFRFLPLLSPPLSLRPSSSVVVHRRPLPSMMDVIVVRGPPPCDPQGARERRVAQPGGMAML